MFGWNNPLVYSPLILTSAPRDIQVPLMWLPLGLWWIVKRTNAFRKNWDGLLGCDIGGAKELGVMYLFPATLKPLSAGLQFGEQTINRAELTAVIQIVRSTNSAIIVTDSAYAVRIFKQVQLDHNPINYHGFDNYDLILLLCSCFHEKSNVFAFQVKKIASHQEVEDTPSLLEKYAILGNRMADLMAKSTTVENRSDFHRASWSLGRTYGKQR